MFPLFLFPKPKPEFLFDLFDRFFFQTDPTKIGPGAPNPSEGVLANFFNSLLSKKTGQTGFQPGQGGAQIKPLNATEDCKPCCAA